MPPFQQEPKKSYRENKDEEKDLPAFKSDSLSSAGYRERKTDDLLSDEKPREYSVLESNQGVDLRQTAEDYLEKMYKATLREIAASDEGSHIDPVYSNVSNLTGLSEVVKNLHNPEKLSLARYIVANLLGDELYSSVGKYVRPYSDLIDEFGGQIDSTVEAAMREIINQGNEEKIRMKEVCDAALQELKKHKFIDYPKMANNIMIANLAYDLTMEAKSRLG